MAMELKLDLKLKQQMVMTPMLQQAIKLLQLSKLELVETVKQELTENPTLEETIGEVLPEGETKEIEERFQAENIEAKDPQEEEKFDWEAFFDSEADEASLVFRSWEVEKRDLPSYENFISSKPSLTDHLLWQLRMNNSDPKILKAGVFIIGNINEDGFLESSLEEIAEQINGNSEIVQKALKLVQNMDPVGVGAANVQECLLIQLEHLNLSDSLPAKIVQNYLKDFTEKKFPQIAEELKVSEEELEKAAEIIRKLEPHPGRQYNVENANYVVPDVFIVKVDDKYEVLINDEGLPRLSISPIYRNLLKRKDQISAETRDFVEKKMRSALWLIKSINRRQHTLYLVTRSILKFQYDFFEIGPLGLKPLVLSDVATDVGVHESTVSRTVTNKYVHTPRGIFELKYFFNSSVPGMGREVLSSLSVKAMIQEIIVQEETGYPYSDEEIVQHLRDKNVNIARRTVAKYREELKIPSSRQRRNNYK